MEELFKVRKDLHRIPEIAYKEHKTHDYIYERLKLLPGIKIITFSFPGLLVVHNGSKIEEDAYFLFRSDMDALPVEEKTGCDFSSTHEGYMHACGHDIHMAILIGFIDYVVKNNVKKNVLFLFQPAEEGQGGAQRVLATGVFDNYNIKETYALHVKPNMPVGTISSCSGVIFGIPQEFDVTFLGKSSHAANPQKGNDSIMAACHFINNTNIMLTKYFAPDRDILFHVGKINGGKIRNTVADQCNLEGTLRALEDMESLLQIVERSAGISASTFNVKQEFCILGSYDPVVNSECLYQKLKNLLPVGISLHEAIPALTGEDFGFFTSRYEGLLFWLGTGESEHDLHSPFFLPDERAILTGIEVFKSLLEAVY